MIRRVYGKVNDQDIVFEKNNKGLWECIIPSSLSGKYFLDLYAEDYANNVAFMATALFEVDPSKLCINAHLVKYDENAMLNEFIHDLSFLKLDIDQECNDYAEAIVFSDYDVEVVSSCLCL